jgi:hypothetical protein
MPKLHALPRYEQKVLRHPMEKGYVQTILTTSLPKDEEKTKETRVQKTQPFSGNQASMHCEFTLPIVYF